MPEESKSKSITRAIEASKSGGVVIFPTDTVYGIGCVFDNEIAVERIYKIKGTKKSQPFPILVSNINQVTEIAEMSDYARELIDKHWPGGLTIILPAGSKKIGFRMPNSDIVRSIIEKVGKPIVGTSANFHGQPAPKSYEELDPNFTKLADFVLAGECKLSQESTVVDVTVSPPIILRQGAVRL